MVRGSVDAGILGGNDQKEVLPLLALLKSEDAEALRGSGALSSENRAIRAAAHSTLGRVGSGVGDSRVLVETLLGKDDYSVRAAAGAGLGDLWGRNAPKYVIDALVKMALDGDHFIVRYNCIAALGMVGGDVAVGALVMVEKTTLEVAGAVGGLGDIEGTKTEENAVRYVRSLRTHGDDLVRGAVARCLGIWGYEEELRVMLVEEENGYDSLHVRNMLMQALLNV